jgi:hypothetical protein
MIIAKRHPLMHRQLAREPGLASYYAGKVSVVLVSLIAAGAAAFSLDHRAPERAASLYGAETGVAASPAARQETDGIVATPSGSLPAARDHIPDTAVDDANARVIADL